MCQPYIESATALSDIYTRTPTRLHYPARLRARVKINEVGVCQRLMCQKREFAVRSSSCEV